MNTVIVLHSLSFSRIFLHVCLSHLFLCELCELIECAIVVCKFLYCNTFVL